MVCIDGNLMEIGRCQLKSLNTMSKYKKKKLKTLRKVKTHISNYQLSRIKNLPLMMMNLKG